ncbi:MAG: DUF3592 domain-containing protein [Pseudomonadota bacterium]
MASRVVDRNWQRISWLILGIGAAILAGGLALAWGSLRHVLHADRAIGEVVEMREEDDMYAPVVRFRSAGGEIRTVKDLASGAPEFAVGDLVTVLHMPGDGGSFRLATFERLWLSAIMIILFGGFWMLFGAIAWALSRGAPLFVVGERAFAVIAVCAAAIAALALANALDLYVGGQRAEGIVAEIRVTRHTEDERVTRADGSEGRRSVERIAYAPVVRFMTRAGREIEFHGRGGSESSLAAGDRVAVIYDPADPIRARIVSFLDLWLPSAVAFAVAVLFGGAVLLSRRSRRRSPPAPQGTS